MKRTLSLTLALTLLFTMGCSLFAFGSSKATEAPPRLEIATTPEVVETASVEPAPVEEEPAMVEEPSGAANNLQDAEKAVIRIVTQGSYEYAGYGSFEESFTGSGFIIDPSGLAVTNNHVVTGAALVQVYFSDDPKPYRARILGSSECSDLAVIDIEGEGYPYLDWYTDSVGLGLDVYSLGYPLGDPEFSQHHGAVSKKSADVQTSWTGAENVLEHDAIINPGNSGGPLVTEEGRVVGINYAAIGDANQYYAITYREAKPILEALKNGESELAIGINGEAFVTDDGYSGIWIYSVASGSAADKAGIRAGDILEEWKALRWRKTEPWPIIAASCAVTAQTPCWASRSGVTRAARRSKGRSTGAPWRSAQIRAHPRAAALPAALRAATTWRSSMETRRAGINGRLPATPTSSLPRCSTAS